MSLTSAFIGRLLARNRPETTPVPFKIRFFGVQHKADYGKVIFNRYLRVAAWEFTSALLFNRHALLQLFEPV
jgi:hypothetical protein